MSLDKKKKKLHYINEKLILFNWSNRFNRLKKNFKSHFNFFLRLNPTTNC